MVITIFEISLSIFGDYNKYEDIAELYFLTNNTQSYYNISDWIFVRGLNIHFYKDIIHYMIGEYV